MNVLEQIVQAKREEVERKRAKVSIDELTLQPLFHSPVMSLSKRIKEGSGIIAEFKRKSPSAGEIQDRDINEVIKFYNANKVSGYSVLTDFDRFGGSLEDLETARLQATGPVLRKEFIVEEYQIFEARAYGADAILLIAEALDEYHATHLTTIAHTLGMEVVMEFHSKEELHKLNEQVDVVGINNRNLKTLETRIETSEELIKYLPYDRVKITESGIHEPEQLERLYEVGYEGCLVGEAILKDPTLLPRLSAAANNLKIIGHEA